MNRFIALFAFLALAHSSFAAVTLMDRDQWKVTLGGFVEADSITDTTRSFNEVVGNGPVARGDNTNGMGAGGREQFSIRNSRFSLTVAAPVVDAWKTKGYLEYDLMGFDPSPGSSNTEAGFYNNPTLRLRHGYIQAEQEEWMFLAGQTWNLLGWQPYYFVPTVQVAPIPGMLYGRTAQFRAVHNTDLSEENHLQFALGVMRPPQSYSGVPGLEAGGRISFDGWSGGFVGGISAARKTQPLSLGISGALRRISVPQNAGAANGATSPKVNYTGHSIVVDALIPVIPSGDGKDPSNTLTLGGEFTMGSGVGDEFNSWTGGLPNPLNSGAAAPNKNTNLDAGIGGYDANNNFSLIDLKTLNVYAQYNLWAASRAWLSAGYSRLYSDNMINITGNTSPIYNEDQAMFVNIQKDLTDQIRLGLEFAQIRTTYTDGTITDNNRYQFSAFFFF